MSRPRLGLSYKNRKRLRKHKHDWKADFRRMEYAPGLGLAGYNWISGPLYCDCGAEMTANRAEVEALLRARFGRGRVSGWTV